MSESFPVSDEPEAVQYLTTPAFSSNDPATEGLRMIPVNDETDDPDWADPAVAAEKKAADWVSEIEGADSQDALDELLNAYAETGKDYSTVTAAAEKKQADLDENNQQ
jgi:hypothetical protein